MKLECGAGTDKPPDYSPCLLSFSMLPGLAPYGTGTSVPEAGDRRKAQLAFPSALPGGFIQLHCPTSQFLSRVQSLRLRGNLLSP